MGWGLLLLAVVVVVLVVLEVGVMRRVLMRFRAARVHPSLSALLDAWELEGAHRVVVAPDGGVRGDAARQAQLAVQGLSNAGDLASTPHGRGAALDVWPASFLPHVPVTAGGLAARWTPWEKLPNEVKLDFQTFGLFAEARGFTWGGRWRSATFPNGDQPHVEVKAWRTLPFPPPTY